MASNDARSGIRGLRWFAPKDLMSCRSDARVSLWPGRSAERENACHELFHPKALALPWCHQSWCYVDPDNCDLEKSKSFFFPGAELWYSYETCASRNFFEIWKLVQLEMCSRFSVVEKPYVIMWLSCWTCAFLQQVIDTTRKLEDQQDRLGKWQRAYLALQLLVLVTETYANMQRIPWSGDFWSSYNLYVYVFINSAVFVRATMMSQVVWDWYEVRLLKMPVLPYQMDGKGWTDEMRAGLLVCIFQFLSSLGVFFVISVTHLIFWAVAAGLVKSRVWISSLNFDPESRFGRALVVGTNSFLSVMGIQVLVTCMVRTYAGEWSSGYLTPLWNDFLVRRLRVWYTCHLRHATFQEMVLDQDFINLFEDVAMRGPRVFLKLVLALLHESLAQEITSWSAIEERTVRSYTSCPANVFSTNKAFWHYPSGPRHFEETFFAPCGLVQRLHDLEGQLAAAEERETRRRRMGIQTTMVTGHTLTAAAASQSCELQEARGELEVLRHRRTPAAGGEELVDLREKNDFLQVLMSRFERKVMVLEEENAKLTLQVRRRAPECDASTQAEEGRAHKSSWQKSKRSSRETASCRTWFSTESWVPGVIRRPVRGHRVRCAAEEGWQMPNPFAGLQGSMADPGYWKQWTWRVWLGIRNALISNGTIDEADVPLSGNESAALSAKGQAAILLTDRDAVDGKSYSRPMVPSKPISQHFLAGNLKQLLPPSRDEFIAMQLAPNDCKYLGYLAPQQMPGKDAGEKKLLQYLVLGPVSGIQKYEFEKQCKVYSVAAGFRDWEKNILNLVPKPVSSPGWSV
eukprot:g31180.t1